MALADYSLGDDKDSGEVMRDYGKVSPQFWVGRTGKAIKARGIECQLVALYLLTNPHTNMLGLYYLPTVYIAHETGLSTEGASKALQSLSEVGFCGYDEAAEFVWVYEMARYQIADSLKENDNRVGGVNREYQSLPKSRFLGEFFDKYAQAFHLESRRDEQSKGSPSEGPSKPLRSQEQEQEQESSRRDAGASQESSKDFIWRVGVQLLRGAGENEKSARSFIGGLCKKHGDEPVREAVGRAAAVAPAEPKAWLTAALSRETEEPFMGDT